ncbi:MULTISPECIES: hypothetical protein [Crossiella]|uniref:Secreted protein n=1 Tax=Crossiella cryophila TaxID=43355 RepID=A0A7W7C5A3_9PSEU|nr:MULTISPECIES: hypothetical protein [Crossiella]MBB4674744.1 hypothetical protein [Crossiella cryophila]MCK2236465.1 hypothetical protein [Crossiella sp. S99.2]MCK2250132.1 hypothetical protein [Crossiella sp. S99.1]
MGIPAWIWFSVAVLAAIAGAVLLGTDRAQRTARNRERRRWAALRGWRFTDEDQVLLTQWKHGGLAYSKQGVAVDVVTGSMFTADGRRLVQVLDHQQSNKVTMVIAAVRMRRTVPTILELWEPSVPFAREREAELDLYGPVGNRYGFTTDMAIVHPLITPDFVDTIDEIGDDIMVVWLEGSWVLAAAPPNADPARLERLLSDLGEVADFVDPFDVDAADDTAAPSADGTQHTPH